MGIVLDNNVLYEILGYFLAIFLGNDAERECQQISRSRIVAIEDGVRVECMTWSWRGTFLSRQEMTVEFLNHLFKDGLPIVSLAAPVLQKLQDAYHVGSGDETVVCLACRVL